MFYLWIGIMAGTFLAYLAMRAGSRRRTRFEPWRSLRWWLAGVVVLMLLIPVVLEFIKTGFGSFGWLEAIKTVLLPWFAGIGFGVWIYLTISPLPGLQDAGPYDAAQDTGPEGAAAAVRRELSFIPIAVAMLAVTFIVSDEQYGWLARLQKLSFGGGGLEFAPRTVTSQQAVSGPSYGSGDVIGEDRVTSLVDFMTTLDQMIDRDFQYLHELGDTTHDNLLNQDKDFANRVVVPLGKHLGIIHAARGYNNLGILIDRSLVDAIRSFVHSGREMKPETRAARQRFGEEVRDKIANSWRFVCDTEERLLDLQAVDPKNEGLVKSCNTAAAASTNAWLSSPGGTAFNYALPYGTLLAAMLLNAADELDSAIRDIDEWVADNSPAPGHAGQSWLVFRALNQAAQLLLASDSSNANSYLAFEHSRNLVEVGERLLNGTVTSADSKLSWQAQRARFAKAEPVDLLWELGLCPNDLTASFKRAMLATLQASNTVAYILSQNIEFAEKKNLIREMDWRADYLAKKVNTRCLTDSKADNVQAAFFDTAAVVELTLAAREKQQPNEKRRRLCNAYKYVQKAIALQENTLDKSTLAIGARPWETGLSRFDFADKWTTHRRELAAYAAWATYNHRLEEISSQLAYASIDC